MFSAVGDALENIDFIGKTIEFRIGKTGKLKTACGGVSTLIILFFLLCLFYLFIWPFILRQDPQITFISTKDIDPNPYNLNNSNFFFGYTLIYQDGKILQESDWNYFNISVVYKSRNSVPKRLNTTKFNDFTSNSNNFF